MKKNSNPTISEEEIELRCIDKVIIRLCKNIES